MACQRISPHPLTKYVAKGFTLAELLIALGILAVIATFTIPKLLQSEQNQRNKALLKETISALSQATYSGIQSGDLTKGSPNWNDDVYYLSNLNAKKICPSNSTSQGCWTVSEPSGGGQLSQAGIVLNNGVAIAGFGPTSNVQDHNWVEIDANGANPPNTEGEDQIIVRLCYGLTGNCKHTGCVESEPFFPTSTTMYEDMFAN